MSQFILFATRTSHKKILLLNTCYRKKKTDRTETVTLKKQKRKKYTFLLIKGNKKFYLNNYAISNIFAVINNKLRYAKIEWNLLILELKIKKCDNWKARRNAKIIGKFANFH